MNASSSGQTVGRPMEILFVEDSLTAARLTIGAIQKGKIQHRMTWLKTGEQTKGTRTNKGDRSIYLVEDRNLKSALRRGIANNPM